MFVVPPVGWSLLVGIMFHLMWWVLLCVAGFGWMSRRDQFSVLAVLATMFFAFSHRLIIQLWRFSIFWQNMFKVICCRIVVWEKGLNICQIYFLIQALILAGLHIGIPSHLSVHAVTLWHISKTHMCSFKYSLPSKDPALNIKNVFYGTAI